LKRTSDRHVKIIPIHLLALSLFLCWPSVVLKLTAERIELAEFRLGQEAATDSMGLRGAWPIGAGE